MGEIFFRGSVWKFGADVDTDVIIPAKYLNLTNPIDLSQHCMEGIDANFFQKVKAGDIIVADKNFGCGSSREHAPLAIKTLGISCVISKSFARIFYRNAFNIGLPILESADAPDNVEEGDKIEVNLDTGKILDRIKKRSFRANSIPPFMQDLIRGGGLMNYIAKRLNS